MSTQFEMSVSGARVEIHPEPVNKEILDQTLEYLGYGDIQTKARTDLQALREAQKEYAKEIVGFKTRVENLKNKNRNGCELVSIRPGESANEYTQEFKARVVSGVVFCESHKVDLRRLQSVFNHFKETLSVGAVRDAIGSVICDKLGGVRTTIGVYWLPEWSVDRFKSVASDLNQIGAMNHYVFPTHFGNEEMRWVSDHLHREFKRLQEELEEGLGERSLREQTLKGRRDALSLEYSRLERLQELLGTSLDDCRDVLKDVEMHLAEAAAEYDTETVFSQF